MIHQHRLRIRSALSAMTAMIAMAALAILLLSGAPAALADRGPGGGDDGGGGGGGGDKTLKLRINDAIGQPGGLVAMVVRTYAARPIRQGRISVRVRKVARAAKAGLTFEALTQPVRPLLTLVSATVYSQRGDSASRAALVGAPDSQAVNVDFASPSGTVNAADGPLAVFQFRLDPAVKPGQEFALEIDPALTALVDAGGSAIGLDPIPAVLTVRAPRDPFAMEAEGDEMQPGETAELGVTTFEPFAVSGGRIALRYDPAIAAGSPTVRMDPRYGRSTFSVDSGTPGLLVVTFKSPDRTLNTVPGTFLAVSLPTAASAVIGTQSAVALDPAGTWLLNAKGRKLRLKLENGTLAFR